MESLNKLQNASTLDKFYFLLCIKLRDGVLLRHRYGVQLKDRDGVLLKHHSFFIPSDTTNATQASSKPADETMYEV